MSIEVIPELFTILSLIRIKSMNRENVNANVETEEAYALRPRRFVGENSAKTDGTPKTLGQEIR